jgi:hypothetical protein
LGSASSRWRFLYFLHTRSSSSSIERLLHRSRSFLGTNNSRGEACSAADGDFFTFFTPEAAAAAAAAAERDVFTGAAAFLEPTAAENRGLFYFAAAADGDFFT